ncbi:hypothetical protein AAVH_35393 [Aphelenchoides avenae]|nr:hypothetical protein AAVH_35393 [Aphelenchus avenae]
MDGRTKRVHAEFKRALLALAVCPLICLVTPIAVLQTMCYLRLNGGILAAFECIHATSIAVVNPLVTICVVHPYRDAALKWLTFGRAKTDASAVSYFRSETK